MARKSFGIRLHVWTDAKQWRRHLTLKRECNDPSSKKVLSRRAKGVLGQNPVAQTRVTFINADDYGPPPRPSLIMHTFTQYWLADVACFPVCPRVFKFFSVRSAPLSSSFMGFFLFFTGATASIGPCPLQQFASSYPSALLVSPSSYTEQKLGVLPDFVFPSRSWSSHRSSSIEFSIQYSYFGILELSIHCNVLSLMINEWRWSVRLLSHYLTPFKTVWCVTNSRRHSVLDLQVLNYDWSFEIYLSDVIPLCYS